MAEDSCAGENSITRVLYIREHDPKLSSRAIAEMAGVSDPLVNGLRPEVQTVSTSKRTGQDGKEYPASRPKQEDRGGNRSHLQNRQRREGTSWATY